MEICATVTEQAVRGFDHSGIQILLRGHTPFEATTEIIRLPDRLGHIWACVWIARHHFNKRLEIIQSIRNATVHRLLHPLTSQTSRNVAPMLQMSSLNGLQGIPRENSGDMPQRNYFEVIAASLPFACF